MTNNAAEDLSADAPNPEDGAAAEEPCLLDWVAEHLEALTELRTMGMKIARSVTRQALAQAELAEKQAEAGAVEDTPRRGPAPMDPGLTFSRISRAVRLTISLEARLHRMLEDGDQGAANDDDAPTGPVELTWAQETLLKRVRKVARAENDYEIRRAVEETIEAAEDDPDTVERLKDELVERLDEDEVFLYRATWPIGEAIDLICQDLGLTPDWDRWEKTRWARKEAAESPLNSPYATFPRPPIPPRQYPKTGTETYREARGLPPLEGPPPLRAARGGP